MKLSGITKFNQSFGILYKNPNGTTVDVSQEAINEAKTTAYIRQCVDTTFKENPQEYYKYKQNESVQFLIDEKGKCILVPKDFDASAIQYIGKTKFGLQRNGTPIEIQANYNESWHTRGWYSDEVGSIRRNGGYKFASIGPDYSVTITRPEYAQK